MLRPIEPIELDLNSRFLRERIRLADAGNVIEKHDYAVDAAREVSGLAPFLECWEQNRQTRSLPKLNDFDAVREQSEIAGVHLLETPTAELRDFRFISFDSTTRVDGQDFSGKYLSDYPDTSFRESARMDYAASAKTGQGRLTVLDIRKAERSGKFARLVLPLAENDPARPSRLLVVVQLLEHCPLKASGNAHPRAANQTGEAGNSVGAAGGEFVFVGPVDADAFTEAQARAHAAASDEMVIRYFQSGIHEQLADHDLLEWMLRQFLGSGDSRVLANVLIDEFGSLPAVLAMGRERLSDFPGLTSQALVSLKVVRELATRLIKTETMGGRLVSDARQVVDYCRARMAHETVEHLRILYLDQKNRLIRDEIFHGGGVSSVIVNPRQIVKRAILLDAQSIIMAHNHPSGDPSPSAADVEVTRDVKIAAEAVEIRLLDHLIIGRSGSVSLRTLGYLDDH